MNQHSFSPAKNHLLGSSVALVADPAGPRVSIIAINQHDGAVYYVASRRESSGDRSEREYRADELLPPA